MIGIVLDSVLMLLLVAALGYGVRLEKKLSALRAGQLAFAGAVNELNGAAGRAQAALSDLRAAGEDADLLHDRIVKARTLKTELEALMARMDRAGRLPSATTSDDVSGAPATASANVGRAGEIFEIAPEPAPRRSNVRPISRLARPDVATHDAVEPRVTTPGLAAHDAGDEDRARRMQALADRIQGMAGGRAAQAPVSAPGRETVNAIVGALSASRTANHSAQDRINRARRSLDEDLFAA